MANLFKGGLATQTHELSIAQLPVQGQLPEWLSGALIRTAPAQFEVGPDSFRHWFDGSAMLHRFAFSGGQVSYQNKMLQSPSYRANNEAGRIRYSEFATDPCRSFFKRVASMFTHPDYNGNGNVNVSRFANEVVALTETPLAMTFDPQTLDTLGVYDYGGTDAQLSTAHPHYDRESGLGLTYAAKLGISNEYRFYSMRGQKLNLLSTVKVKKPAYVHSFGMSARYLVLAESSLRLTSAVAMALSGKPFIENFKWKAGEDSRFIVLDKATGKVVAEVATEPFFVFHHVNAFEQAGEVVVDIVAYPNNDLINAFYLDKLRAEAAGVPGGELRRYRVPLAGGRATYELLASENLELPRINYDRYNTRGDYRYVYGASIRRGTHDFYNQLTKFDLQDGSVRTWYADGCYPGEPVFVAAPGEQAEDDGVILSVVLDGARDTSFLLVLDAQSFTEVGRATVPQYITLGFHGQFFPSL